LLIIFSIQASADRPIAGAATLAQRSRRNVILVTCRTQKEGVACVRRKANVIAITEIETCFHASFANASDRRQMHQLLMERVIMGKLDAEQKPDLEARELTERELNEVSGGDGPPSTAGDGNGRVYLR
jgi:hypothetical protein